MTGGQSLGSLFEGLAGLDVLTTIDRAQSYNDAHAHVWAPFVVVGEPTKEK